LDVQGNGSFTSGASVTNVFVGSAVGNGGATVRFLGSNTQKNWMIGNQFNVSGALEFTPSTTTGGATFTTPAMLIDSFGNLGIGTTSPNYRISAIGSNTQANFGATNNKGAFVVSTSDSQAIYTGGTYYNGSNWVAAATTASYVACDSGNTIFTNNSGLTSGNTYTPSERARITSGGDFCVNTTAKVYEGLISVSFDGNGGSGDQGIALIDTNASLNGDYLLFVNSAGNVAGKITHNGTTTVAYTTSSDYRLKNTIAPITGALAKVALLKPCTYKWNVDGSDGQGFIAHELAEVVPDCVVGEKDAVDAEGKPRYQGVDTSFLVATLTAAIQELTARVAQLESK
jgi:hypothetical protein